MPITRLGGKPVVLAMRCVISSSGFVTTTTTRLGAWLADALGDAGNDLRVDAGQVRAAHARLAGAPRRDDDVVRALRSPRVRCCLLSVS